MNITRLSLGLILHCVLEIDSFRSINNQYCNRKIKETTSRSSITYLLTAEHLLVVFHARTCSDKQRKYAYYPFPI